MRGFLLWLLRALVVGGCYYAGARLGLSLALFQSQVTPLWPPTGIATAALLYRGRSMVVPVAVAAFCVNAPLGPDLLTAVLISVGNSLAPLAAATLLRRTGFRPELTRVKDAILLVGVGTAAMTISATVGVAALLRGGLPGDRAPGVWLTWWTGDAMGVLVCLPVLVCLLSLARLPRPGVLRALEFCALLALTGATAVVGFRTDSGLRFLVFPVLAFAAVRFRLAGAAFTSLIASLVATQAASEGIGLFHGQDDGRAMVALQLFNGSVTFMTYLLAALTSDRERAREAQARIAGELEHRVHDRTAEYRSALERLGEAQSIARMGSYEFDLATGTAVWSDELYRLLLMPVGTPVTLSSYLDLCHPEERVGFQGTLQEALASAGQFTLDHRLRRADGSYRWIHCRGQVVLDADGRVVGTRGTATDIEDRKLAERRFGQLVEMAPDAMVFVDADGIITQLNRQTETLFGWSREQLVGQSVEVLIPARFRARHAGHRRGFFGDAGTRPMGRGLDLLAVRADGTEFPVEISLSPMETDRGTHACAAIRDVTERRLEQAQLEHQSTHDGLTGLPNRTLLVQRLSSHLTPHGDRVAVVFLDLDRFKWVNDSLGHDAGDVLLRTVAARLRSAIRPEDTLARFGGDEFVVVSPGHRGVDDVLALTSRLRSAVSQVVDLPGGHTVVPTMSIGFTTTDDPGADPSALLREADAAMYRAKELGRDRTAAFEPVFHEQMSARLSTSAGLQTAIDDGQLRVHYQPIVDLVSGRAVAVEALVRWQHPERGLLLPGEFIGLAEETGRAGALDHEVIVRACLQIADLTRGKVHLADLGLSVNVSLRHLSLPQLRRTLTEGLLRSGLEPSRLTVEVTESADLRVTSSSPCRASPGSWGCTWRSTTSGRASRRCPGSTPSTSTSSRSTGASSRASRPTGADRRWSPR